MSKAKQLLTQVETYFKGNAIHHSEREVGLKSITKQISRLPISDYYYIKNELKEIFQ